MKSSIKIFSLFSIIISLSACQKFLDIKPEQQLINDSAMTTERDLKAVLEGAYDGLQSSSVAGGDLTAFGDLMADDFDVLPNRLSNFGTSEIYNGQTSVQIGALSEMWKQHYSVINRANNVIRTIDLGSITGPEFNKNKNVYKAEALFMRAYCHYNLLQVFALPYNINNKGGNTQPGVVLRTQPTLNGPNGLSKARATVEECYALIISDLNEAFNLMKAAGVEQSIDRVSAMAAKAMLARVYFTIGFYTDATAAANEVIGSNKYLLANNDGKDSTKIVSLFYNAGNSVVQYNGKPEVIWQLVNTRDDNSGSLFGYYFSTYFMKVKTNVISSIDSLDDRIIRTPSGSTVGGKSSFTKLITTGDWYTAKHNRPTGINYSSNVVLLRLSEMYLIKAEASALATNSVSTEASDAYNTLKLRNYGIGSYVAESFSDLSDFLTKIRAQRRIELLAENGDRYTQLRRLGLPLRDGTSNYAKFLFKIPQEEMASNELMEQNP
jgi:hypothetical protein